MSDRVTWESCPRCGGRAAVGWAFVTRGAGEPAAEVPVEFDCPAGCRFSATKLLQLAVCEDVASADQDRSAADRWIEQ